MQFAERQPLDRSRSVPAPTPLRLLSDHGPKNQRLTVGGKSERRRSAIGSPKAFLWKGCEKKFCQFKKRLYFCSSNCKQKQLWE